MISNQIKKWQAISAISGRENAMADLLLALLAQANISAHKDDLGNVIAHRPAKQGAKKMMLCTAMDTVGALVTEIGQDGRLHLCPVGTYSAMAFAYSKIVTESGVKGVFVPQKAPTDSLADYVVDIGASNRAAAMRRVKIGDAIRFCAEVGTLSSAFLCGAGVASRARVALLVDCVLNATDSPYDLYFVFSTQSQLGARGVGTAAYAISPDAALLIEDAICCDSIAPGKGVTIRHRDAQCVYDVALTHSLQLLAKELSIPHTHQISADAAGQGGVVARSGQGVRVASLCLPVSHLKTPAETVHTRDITHTQSLLLAWIRQASLLS